MLTPYACVLNGSADGAGLFAPFLTRRREFHRSIACRMRASAPSMICVTSISVVPMAAATSACVMSCSNRMRSTSRLSIALINPSDAT